MEWTVDRPLERAQHMAVLSIERRRVAWCIYTSRGEQADGISTGWLPNHDSLAPCSQAEVSPYMLSHYHNGSVVVRQEHDSLSGPFSMPSPNNLPVSIYHQQLLDVTQEVLRALCDVANDIAQSAQNDFNLRAHNLVLTTSIMHLLSGLAGSHQNTIFAQG